VGKSVSLVDGNGVGNTISRVENDTGSSTGSVQGEDGLDRDVESGGVEGLEHDLGPVWSQRRNTAMSAMVTRLTVSPEMYAHLLSVDLGVEGSLSQENGVLLRCDTELIVEGVMPDLG
jgi:hypothetical protein